MNQDLPGLVITGASGFVGRHVMAALAGKYRLFCLARRSQAEAGIPQYDSQRWTQVDISNWESLKDIERCITANGGADFVLHLAGYYDFTNKKHPQYESTNVLGTKNVLEFSRLLNIKHFIFSSSLAACPFPDRGQFIDEETKPTANIPYAISKRRAEELICSYSHFFHCSIMRLAAIFSDWCEYPPVYMFLSTWLYDKWNRRILAGKGNSAIPYLHIYDLIKLITHLLESNFDKTGFSIYNASPLETVSHKQLFLASTRFFYGQEKKPILIPKIIALPCVALRQWIKDFLGLPVFERIWMIRYIDRKMTVDARKTYQALNWKPTPRYNLIRRLLIIIENLKRYPEAWHLKNEAAMQHAADRPNLMLSSILIEMRDELINEIAQFISSQENTERFCHYHMMPMDTIKWFISLIYQILVTSIRTRDRTSLRNYARIIAYQRFKQGFKASQVCDMVLSIGKIVSKHLLKRADLKNFRQDIYDYIILSMQLTADEIEDVFEEMQDQSTYPNAEKNYIDLLTNNLELKRMVEDLQDICKDGWNIELFSKKDDSENPTY